MDYEGSILYDPMEDRMFVEELKKLLLRPIQIEEVDGNLEEIKTAQALVNSLDNFMKEARFPGEGPSSYSE